MSNSPFTAYSLKSRQSTRMIDGIFWVYTNVCIHIHICICFFLKVYCFHGKPCGRLSAPGAFEFMSGLWGCIRLLSTALHSAQCC